MKSSKKAFTLIELLVVIAIIGILATISVVAFQNARAKARDAKRIADAKQMQTALEMFFNDQNRFPTAAEFNSGSLTIGDKVYMMNLPVAPTPADGNCDNVSNQFSYTVDSAGTSFTLSYCLGSKTGALDGGPKCLTRDGFSNSACGASACTANCSGKCSGSDGCGGTCPDNCTGGQVCVSGTCATPQACGEQVTITSLAGHTCNTGAPDYDTCTYNTVQIGTQCWMTKNMNVGSIVAGATNQTNNSTLEKYCYNDSYGNCQTEGALYQWDEAMQYSVTELAQGICPDGWHIPTDAEQNTLDQYLNDTTCNANRIGAWDCANAGTKLQAGGTSHFEGLLAGFRNTNGSFYDQGTHALFWSSSVSGPDAWNRTLGTGRPTVNRNRFDRAYGFSVRCLQD